MTQQSDKPIVFAKFLGKEILGEMGRLLFSLLDAFSASGSEIRLFDNLPPSQLGKYGTLAYSLNHFTLTDTVPPDTRDAIYLFDKEDRAVGRREWRKKVQVKFDVFSPYWFTDPIIMPYPVHPVHTGPDLDDRVRRYRSSERRVRILFSGDVQGYTKNRIRYPKEKLTRLDVINTILERLGDNLVLVKTQESLEEIFSASGYKNKCVMADPLSLRIDHQQWLSTLAKCDFFLCPPGYVMPMCHNITEAMAVGAIPITNYPEWLNPSLVHQRECIAFEGRGDLIDRLTAVLQMPADRVVAMRQQVINYYQDNLTASSFIRKIEASSGQKVVVLMITDANVMQHAERLNRYSVLMRSTSAHGTRSLLRGLRTRKL
jgi:hypothetical protein